MPEDMSEYMPEDIPDRMPEDMPEDLPDNMPEDMPDRMPNRMSEDMSDRMPEDLPVRKCINVMVVITRSKVIFLIFVFLLLFLFCSLAGFHVECTNSLTATSPWPAGCRRQLYKYIRRSLEPDLLKHVKHKNSNPFCRGLKGTCHFVGAWHGRE